MRLTITPVTLSEARDFVAQHHRHNKPPVGWKFGAAISIGANRVGVVTAGRPVSRETQKREPRTLEVSRTCTDGSRNANSMLYGAIWRAAKALGYTRCITYTQADEDGASLRAAGWVKVKELPARGSWADHTADAALKAMRDPCGNGGIGQVLWEIKV